MDEILECYSDASAAVTELLLISDDAWRTPGVAAVDVLTDLEQSFAGVL